MRIWATPPASPDSTSQVTCMADSGVQPKGSVASPQAAQVSENHSTMVEDFSVTTSWRTCSMAKPDTSAPASTEAAPIACSPAIAWPPVSSVSFGQATMTTPTKPTMTALQR
ncbi:MAG: hypothetical protein BGN94_15680 [Rhizobiales bacterium 68-8]|nr:MAG: hypothetical protein BGN94_15680 [Rhizobiales bacterium 68-8]